MPDPSFWFWLWPRIWWPVHVLLVALVSVHCLGQRKAPASTMLWIFLSWTIPGLGPFLYLSFGVNRVQVKGFAKHLADMHLLAKRRGMIVLRDAETTLADDYLRELNRALNSISPNHPLLGGNSVVPLTSGDEAYSRMLESIAGARSNIHLMTYILQNDATGRRFMDALAAKAGEGVKVRALYDRFGSSQAVWTGFFRRYRGIPNMEVVGWTQANPLKRQFQVNLRNHRKILVVDGSEAFIGGMNIHDDHTTARNRPPIRDYHFMVRGPVVHELQYTFTRDWYFMTDHDPDEMMGGEYFPPPRKAGGSAVRVINGGPASEMENIADVFFTATVAARRQVLAVTPYFVPHHDLIQAMRSAALRGLDVRLVVPRKNNHLSAGYASRALYEDLLRSGVRIFERRPPFMHAKAFLVDDDFAFVGTSNMDVRSFRLDYETNLAVYDPAFASELKRIVLEDIAESSEVNLAEWRNRPYRQRVLENLFTLMTPVL